MAAISRTLYKSFRPIVPIASGYMRPSGPQGLPSMPEGTNLAKKDETKAELVEVSVANPPAPSEKSPKPKEQTRENATAKMRLGGFLTPVKSIGMKGAVGGAGGLFAALAVPRLIGWADGSWKELVAIGGTTIVGSWLVSKWDRNAGVTFAAVGIAVLIVKVVRMALGQGAGLLGTGIGGRIAEEAYGGLNGLGSSEVFGGIGQDEELFVGQSPLEPTYTGAM